MQLFFFGPHDARLFGALETPPEGVQDGCGVVLCYPLGYEYFRSHRAFRQLSRRLVRAGIATLRFDYFGTGDSMGEHEEVRVARCVDGISRAMAELRQRTGVRRMALVGRRFGAVLAAEVAAGRGDVDGLVLWDPVVSGRRYLDKLEEDHKKWMTTYRGRVSVRLREPEELVREAGDPLEALGMTMHPELLEEIAGRELSIPQPERLKTLVLTSEQNTESAELVGRLRQAGASCDLEVIPDRKAFNLEELLPQLVPNDQNQFIVEWLLENV